MIFDFTVWDPANLNKFNALKNNHQNINKVILDGVLEGRYEFFCGSKDTLLELVKFTQDNNIELHITTASHSSTNLLPPIKNLRLYYWPTFWLTLTFKRLTEPSNYNFNSSLGLDLNDIEVGKNNSIIYPYITMNKAPKVHRAIMLDMLAKHNIIDNGVVIWREPIRNYTFKFWEEKILLRDQVDGFKVQEILPIEYANSFSQVVTESDDEIFILSEKTGMPLFFNKPFLVVGCKNFHKILKDMGFLLYDELFDYSFDDHNDVNVRCDLIAKNMSKYANKSPDELKILYETVFEKCVYNKKMALKLATTSKFIPNIWKELIAHHKENNLSSYPEDINNFILQYEHKFRF